MRTAGWLWIGIVVLAGVLPVRGQIRGYNLFEFQVGNTPFTNPSDLTSGYDQLHINYNQDAIRAALRLEQFFTRLDEREYQQLTQYRFSYQDKGAEVTVGHFYDMLGRGLLLRAYEIPGVVLEDAAFRVRRGFYRDIQGVKLGYHNDRFAIKALRGKPLINLLPPTLSNEERRDDLIEALDGQVKFGDYAVGGSFLRNNKNGETRDYAAISGEGELPLGISVYAELAQRVGTDFPIANYGDDAAFAFYGSLAFTKAAFGLSLEYKKYNDFFLGSGFNDPPSLIKEHAYAVLNRSTHVLNLVDEQGIQAEVFYRLPKGSLLTFNATRAVNALPQDYIYQEYFAEYFAPLPGSHSVKVFFDYAEDPFRFEKRRLSGGTYLTRRLPRRWSAAADIEVQTFQRTLGETSSVQNTVLGLSLSQSSRYSIGVVWETSTDPFLTDNTQTISVETAARHWFGGNIGYRPNRNHTIALFAGTRRGGPACTSGICYEVLDFEGVELRVTSKF